MDTKSRIKSVDILRGYSMFLMMLVHTQKYWLEPVDWWLPALIFVIFNFSGTPQFTYVAGMGFGLSWRQAKLKGEAISSIKSRSLVHTWMLLLISFGYNVFATVLRGTGWAGLWYWNILQCIAISRLITSSLMQYSRKIRIGMALVILILGNFLILIISPTSASLLNRIIYYLFFNPKDGDIIMIFIPYFIIGTIIGEYLAELEIRQKKTDSRTRNIPQALHKMVLYGILVAISGIVMGCFPTSIDFWNLIPLLNLNPEIDIQTLPMFLTVNMYAWAFISTGIHLILTGIAYYLWDWKYISQKWIQPFYIYGLFSLTIYFFHYLLLALPLILFRQYIFAVSNIWIWILGFMLSIWAIFEYNQRKYKGVISFEYLTTITAKLVIKRKEGNDG